MEYKIYGLHWPESPDIVYVGQTKMKLRQRIALHRKKKHRELQITLIEGGLTKDQADEREIYWIKYYDTYHNGLNHTEDGQAYPPKKERKLKRYNKSKQKMKIQRDLRRNARLLLADHEYQVLMNGLTDYKFKK